MPSRSRREASRLAASLVRVKTSTWCRSRVADQVGEQRLLAVAVDRIDELLDRLGGRVPRRHLDRGRVAQDRAGQPPDVVGERRREHQVLPAGGQQRDDLLDVRQEAHVEHPVGLVEDEDLDLAEVRDALPDEVEQPARRGDEDLDPARAGP